MDNKFFVLSRAVPPAMSVGLLLSTLTGRIEVIVGGECMVSNLTVHSEVDFKQILMSCISLISKVRFLYFLLKEMYHSLIPTFHLHETSHASR